MTNLAITGGRRRRTRRCRKTHKPRRVRRTRSKRRSTPRRRRRRGGNLGAVLSEAIVPFGITAAAIKYGQRKSKRRGRRTKRRGRK